MRAAAVFLAGMVLLAEAVAAPIDDFRLPGVGYDASIETPDEFLGFGLGEHPVRHDQLVRYLTGLAASSDRIKVETIGETHERRPILLFTVTSPENHARLDSIRARHLASLEGGERGADDPAIVWINYGVHGAESAGMDAAIPALYHFAAAEGDAIERQLRNSVILIVAILNPDGHSRRVNHVETFSGEVTVTDPAAEVHNLWTEARTNHYWFDLNRQWLPATQPEAKAWVATWQAWKPHVSADFHEMGSQSTYYFHPGEPRRKNPLIPDEARALTKNIAERHRDFLDSEARLYTTEQGFDNFYIGKGSTYPQVNGGLGILFEVGAARGGVIENASGGRDYADNIRTHFRTTLTTLDGTLEQREEIATYQQDFFRQAAQQASEDPVKAYVVTGQGDRTRLQRFVDLLKIHDIRVHELTQEVNVGEVAFRPGEAVIVPMEQMQYVMLRGIFDRVTTFEENIFYDVSGWTVPLAFDLDYAPLKTRVSRGETAGRFEPSLLGDPARERGQAEAPQRGSYGYIMPWADHMAAGALYGLLDGGLLVRVAREPFEVRTADGLRSFAAGSVFVPLARQPLGDDAVHDRVAAIARETGVPFVPITSGAGDDEIVSLGGGSFEPVEKPQVLLLFDDGISGYDAGEVWHLLDHEMAIPVTLRRKDDLGGLDWSRYSHLILAGGNGRLGERAEERVGQWIREEGGTLIALRQSAHYAQDAFLETPAAEAGGESEEQERQRINYSEMDVRDAEHIIGGAIVATDLDPSHPLGFGYQNRFLPSLRNTTATLDWPQDNPYAVVSAYPATDVVLSGYVSQRRRDELAGTPAVIAQPLGRGQVILMADNPVFRGFFLGTNKLLLNSIFFSGLIDSPSGDYEEE